MFYFKIQRLFSKLIKTVNLKYKLVSFRGGPYVDHLESWLAKMYNPAALIPQIHFFSVKNKSIITFEKYLVRDTHYCLHIIFFWHYIWSRFPVNTRLLYGQKQLIKISHLLISQMFLYLIPFFPKFLEFWCVDFGLSLI